MPWAEDHKERTRERIVGAAAAALRARGIDGVSIAEIMAEAGLTHGGFYAHFGSKEDLLRAALEASNGQTIEMLSGARSPVSGAARLDTVIDTYLSPAHAAHPERGCPLAALGPELTRTTGPVRRDVARGVEQRVAWLERLLPGGARDEQDATAVLACLVGGLVLARAVDPDQSTAVLDATRAFIRRALQASRGKGAVRAPCTTSHSSRRHRHGRPP